MEDWDEELDCKEYGFKESLKLLQTNLWVSHKTLERICTFGSQSDLSHLRQLNQKHYNTLNPTFLDAMDKCVRITSGPDINNMDSRVHGRLRIKCCKAPPIQAFVREGENNKPINPKNWTKGMSHIFRKLEYVDVGVGEFRITTAFLVGISSQLAPYITTLRLNTIRKSFAKVLNGFPSLKYLELDYTHERSMWTGANGLKPDQLVIELGNLHLKPKIKIFANCGHKEILSNLEAKENLSVELKFGSRFFEENDLTELENIVKIYGHLRNINYKIHYVQDSSHLNRDLRQLEMLTRICLELDSKIQKLKLSLTFFGGKEIEEGKQLLIKRSLAQMSPYVKNLHISQRLKPSLDILPHDSEWPQLKDLWIEGYEHPLEIFKKCSKLQELALDVDQRSCFFSDTQQSEKENLGVYFGNLSQLNQLVFPHDERDEDKIAEGNELHEHLKRMLPQLKSINYGEFIWDTDN